MDRVVGWVSCAAARSAVARRNPPRLPLQTHERWVTPTTTPPCAIFVQRTTLLMERAMAWTSISADGPPSTVMNLKLFS